VDNEIEFATVEKVPFGQPIHDVLPSRLANVPEGHSPQKELESAPIF
jgi:hypothetical protein